MIPKLSRNPWPVAIIGFFVVAICFIVSFVVWATHQREDLVSSDYYEQEVLFQRRLDTLNRTQPIAVTAVVTFEPATRAIIITLPPEQRLQATGSIQLYRPSDARLDRRLQLQLDPNGVQRLEARELHEGLWRVRIQWTAHGKEYFLDQPVIVSSV